MGQWQALQVESVPVAGRPFKKQPALRTGGPAGREGQAELPHAPGRLPPVHAGRAQPQKVLR
eukprot:5947059-Alexandrium_andersonii.AAC.1